MVPVRVRVPEPCLARRKLLPLVDPGMAVGETEPLGESVPRLPENVWLAALLMVSVAAGEMLLLTMRCLRRAPLVPVLGTLVRPEGKGGLGVGWGGLGGFGGWLGCMLGIWFNMNHVRQKGEPFESMGVSSPTS